jgi:hypothetical protein
MHAAKTATHRRSEEQKTLPIVGQFNRSWTEIHASQIKVIMLFGGRISLFANLRIGNTESYVFLAAKTTYVE